MPLLLLFTGLVIAMCVLTGRIAAKLPVPSLLIFIALGMLAGENGLLRIPFSDFALTEQACTVALLFIMFYGGFSTNVTTARPVAVQAVALSTLGVALTAGLVAVFAHFVLNMEWLVAGLLGSMVASTDAASVFNVLREHKLSLKDGTDSLLEVESGSNDPLSYMLTVVFSSLLVGEQLNLGMMIAAQLVFGIACGLGLGFAAAYILERVHIDMEQGETIFLFALALIAYALPSILGGNGFLSVYLAGIILGHADIPAKRSMVHFFDILTSIAQMTIFFLLGLLVTPAHLPSAILPALGIACFLVVIGRPVAVGSLLFFWRSSIQRIMLVSWAGLRGAASAVFALYALTVGVPGAQELFNIVFVLVLISLIGQGSLLPLVARRLQMVDTDHDIMRTFNDFQEESDVSFIQIKIHHDHPYAFRTLAEIGIIKPLLAVVVLREGSKPLLAAGTTRILPEDVLILAGPSFEDRADLALREFHVSETHRWAHHTLAEIGTKTNGELIVAIKRNDAPVLLNGETKIEPGDLVVALAH